MAFVSCRVAVFIWVFVATLLCVGTRWVRLNGSASVPRGLYLLGPVQVLLAPATLVVLPVPASVHAWHAWWIPLLKPVAGVSGDVVCLSEAGLSVNGVPYGPVVAVAHGQSLPALAPGCHTVPPAHVFLASPVPGSLDGRYFGMTPVAMLTAQATPLFTWR